MKKYLLNKTLTYLLKDYLNLITTDDFLQIKQHKLQTKIKKVVYRDNQPLSEKEQGFIKSEARILKRSDLYKMLTNELKIKAQNNLFNRSTSIDDMIAGKAMLYSIKLIEDKVTELENL
jgi:hypothetical protein